jgi:hypothetical protein
MSRANIFDDKTVLRKSINFTKRYVPTRIKTKFSWKALSAMCLVASEIKYATHRVAQSSSMHNYFSERVI